MIEFGSYFFSALVQGFVILLPLVVLIKLTVYIVRGAI